MTFEEEILEALRSIADKAPGGYDYFYQDNVLEAIAPRVAAAIIATAKAAHAKAVANVQSIPTLVPSDAGLAALRGEG